MRLRSLPRYAGPTLLLGLITFALHFRQLLGQRLFMRDTHLFHAPGKLFLAEAIGRRELPLWWPYDGGGSPFLAQPQFSVFHPSTLLYFVLPFWQAFAAQDMAATLIALAGTYLLARQLDMTKPAAIVAAVLFAANGFMVMLTELTFIKLTAASIPWYLAAIVLAVREPKWWWLPTVAMGGVLLAAEPQNAILASIAGLVLAVAVGWGRRSILLACLSPAGGALLAAVQLLPSLSIVGETERGAPMDTANRWPLELHQLAGLVLPVDFGPLAFMRYLVFGIVGFVLVGAGIANVRHRRVTVALCALAAMAFWLALGDDFGLNAFARKVVLVWGLLRYSTKCCSLLMLMLALLAGEGLDALFVESHSRARCGAMAGLAVALAFVATQPQAVVDTWRWTAVAAGIVAIVFLLSRSGWRHASLAAAGLVALQSVATGEPMLRTVDPSFYDPPPLAKVLENSGVGLTGQAFERMDERPFDPEELGSLDRAGIGGHGVMFGAMFHLPILTYYMPAASLRVRSVFGEHELLHVKLAARLYGLFGVGYLVGPTELFNGAGFEIVGHESTHDYSVARLSKSLPRAYAVHRAVGVENLATAVQRLKDGPFKPGREVLIEGASRSDWSSRPDELAVDAQLTGRTDSSVTIDAVLPWPGFVVLNEAAYKGWSVQVDGQPAQSLIANAFVRAVEVPAGRHEVRWTYRAPGLWAGAVTSAVAWLLILGAALLVARRRSGPANGFLAHRVGV